MKIKLKLKPDHINILERLLGTFPVSGYDVRTGKAHKAIINIVKGIYMKVLQKAAAEQLNPTQKKTLGLTLEYHEAWVLEMHLRRQHYLIGDMPYEYNAILALADELDQKLQ